MNKNTCIRVTLGDGTLTLDGMDFNITKTNGAFGIETPEINAVYPYILGHDCHSIAAGAGHADGMIAQLEDYIKKGYDLVLTSYYTTENLEDAETKIANLKELKATAAGSGNAGEFKAAVATKYPGYAGENYQNMTAVFFLKLRTADPAGRRGFRPFKGGAV